VKVHLHALPKKEMTEQLLIGDIDLTVTLSTIQAPTVRSEVLAGVRVVALMREADPLADMAEVTPRDLVGRSLISYGNRADVSPMLDEAYSHFGLVRDVSIEISSSVGAVPLVSGGLGIALVDGLVKWNSFPGLVARPFSPAVMMNLAISTNSARPVSRLFRPFLHCIREFL
jgi:DNA-binding transcriptional LysR family regulator